jgi:putative endonuclease
LARRFFVNIMTNASRTMYVGMTTNLERRMYEHKQKLVPGFTSWYNIMRLVHIEGYPDPRSATGREKEIKGWRRSKKLEPIEASKPEWHDLSPQWYED